MIADFHNDYLTDVKKEDIIRDYASSKNIIVGAIFKGDKDFERSKSILDFFLKNKRENLYFAFEDFSYRGNLDKICSYFLDRNPVYVGLTWNGENSLAYGAMTSGKIKKRGVFVVKELKKRNISVDVAHLSEDSFYDLLNYTDDILCSHACFYDVNPHPRNLKKRQIKEIIARGGLIGLTLYSPFLTGRGKSDVKDVIKHIDYFADNFSLENLAVGTDFYGAEDFPDGFSNYSFEEILIENLFKRGYSMKNLNDIIFNNLSSFLQKQKLDIVK